MRKYAGSHEDAASDVQEGSRGIGVRLADSVRTKGDALRIHDEPVVLDQVPVRVAPDGNGPRGRGGSCDVVVDDLHVIDVEEADPGVPDMEGVR